MTLASIFPLAFAALRRNKMRSLLTTLGIVIGVAAVVTMQAMGEGATAYVGEAISGMGSNMLIVVPGSARNFGAPQFGVPLFTMTDVDAVRRRARAVRLISPANTRVLRTLSGSNNHNVGVGGVTPEYFEIRQWRTSRGRLFSADENRQGGQVCILGQTVVDALFPNENPLGGEMRVHDLACTVIGVMEAKGTSAFGTDQDDVVFMPYTTFSRRIIGTDRVGTIIVSAVSADRADEAKRELEAIMRHQRHILPGEEDDFSVRDPREVQAVLQTVTGMLTSLLAGVAAVSLLVGGIGIMNIMLVSVTERTREIGLRLAVGARGGDVLLQFLVEAMILSAAGGLIGIATGLAGALAAARLIHVPYVIPGLAMPIAFGVSVLVGVFFGVFPARKASRLRPLTALRFE